VIVGDLADVLAKHPEVITTNTPLEVLAAHMLASLQLFEDSLKERAAHDFYRPGQWKSDSASP
jgi:hypothetical protein